MTADVTIPAETAKAIAAWLRTAQDTSTMEARALHGWADLLDPRPTLRDAVARAICHCDGEVWDQLDDYSRLAYSRNADAALAVVRDHIAAVTRLVDTGYRQWVDAADLDALFDGAES